MVFLGIYTTRGIVIIIFSWILCKCFRLQIYFLSAKFRCCLSKVRKFLQFPNDLYIYYVAHKEGCIIYSQIFARVLFEKQQVRGDSMKKGRVFIFFSLSVIWYIACKMFRAISQRLIASGDNWETEARESDWQRTLSVRLGEILPIPCALNSKTSLKVTYLQTWWACELSIFFL